MGLGGSARGSSRPVVTRIFYGPHGGEEIEWMIRVFRTSGRARLARPLDGASTGSPVASARSVSDLNTRSRPTWSLAQCMGRPYPRETRAEHRDYFHVALALGEPFGEDPSACVHRREQTALEIAPRLTGVEGSDATPGTWSAHLYVEDLDHLRLEQDAPDPVVGDVPFVCQSWIANLNAERTVRSGYLRARTAIRSPVAKKLPNNTLKT